MSRDTLFYEIGMVIKIMDFNALELSVQREKLEMFFLGYQLN
jgi:hypothetical protein